MKQTVNKYDFERAFVDAGRKDQFSYEGRGLLFDYLEQSEDDTGQEIELDVVALCCDYAEETWQEVARYYEIDLNDADAEDEDYEDQCKKIVREYLEENTQLVGETADGFVYATF